jgi:glycosyltransferase involved in cell wall biosynthesis
MLFQAGSADALGHAILGLLAAKDRWPTMRAAGRRFVETERNWTVSVANYRRVYASLTGRA